MLRRVSSHVQLILLQSTRSAYLQRHLRRGADMHRDSVAVNGDTTYRATFDLSFDERRNLIFHEFQMTADLELQPYGIRL